MKPSPLPPVLLAGLLLVFPFWTGGKRIMADDESPGGASSRKTVAVVPLEAVRDTPYNRALADTATEDLIHALGLTGRFDVARAEDFAVTDTSLALYAERMGPDLILFGALDAAPRAQRVEVSVYDSSSGRVTVRESERYGATFEIFAAVDRLVRSIFSDLTGERIAYGSIRFVNEGERGSYDIRIDGEEADRDVTIVKKVLAGSHAVEILQDRMLGNRVIASGEVSVQANRTATFEFAIPYLMEEESRAIDVFLAEIGSNDDDREAAAQVRETYRSLLALFGDLSYCPSLARERDAYLQRYGEYVLKSQLWVLEDRFADPDRSVYRELLDLYGSLGQFPRQEAILQGIQRNGSFLFSILELDASYDFYRGYWSEGVAKYRLMDDLVQNLPLQNVSDFERDRRFLFTRWGRYLKRAKRNEVFADAGLSVRIGNHFRDRINVADSFFKRYRNVQPRELIVLTVPDGLEITVDGRRRGTSPLRLRRLSGDRVTVQVDDPWFSHRTDGVVLNRERNFLFLYLTMNREIRTHPAQVQGRRSIKLSWDGIAHAVGYTVEVGVEGERFQKPAYEQEGITAEFVVIEKTFKRGVPYVFRVRAVNERGVFTPWSYGSPFVVE
jgi:TolB-like protein